MAGPATPRVVRILGRIRDAVRDGAAFAAALADHPASFSRLYVGLIRAGEAGGALAATLERLAVLLERERALASTVTSALIYPGVLLLAAVGSVALLLTSVLPQFVPLFEESGAKLPASTRMMIAAGDIVSDWGPWVLAGSVPLLFAASRLLRRPAPRLFIDRLLLRLPVVGPLAREVLAARLTRTLGTLLVVEALDVVRDALGNAAGAAAVEAATRDTREGAGLAGPLAATGLFPPRTTYLLQLGEETAKLGAMALRAADIHEEKTRLAVQRLVSLLTPAITIGMGAVIAAIVSSLLQAMLGLNDLVQ
jgi:general secretion pathway protein F